MNTYLSNLALRGAGLTSSMLTSQPRLDYSFEPIFKISATMDSKPELNSTEDAKQEGHSRSQPISEQRFHPPNASTRDMEGVLSEDNQTILSSANSKDSISAIQRRNLSQNGGTPNHLRPESSGALTAHAEISADPSSNNKDQGIHQANDSPHNHVSRIEANESDVSQTAKEQPGVYTAESVHDKKDSFIEPRPESFAADVDRHAYRQIERSIHVHIGTIEVRAVSPPISQPMKELAVNRPILSLDEYLRRRNEGKI